MKKISSIEDLSEEIKKLQPNECLKLTLLVNASAKNNSIEFSDEHIKIRIKEKAIEGRANKAIISYLSDILNIKKRNIEILQGTASRFKILQIKSDS